MAIEYCVRCGKRVTSEGEAAKTRLCAWCLAKNPASPVPGKSALPGPADSTTTGALLPRPSAMQWIVIVLVVAAAGAGAFVLARRGPGGADLRARFDAIKADVVADSAFERMAANERAIAELRTGAPADLAIDLDALLLDTRARFEDAAAKACRSAMLDVDGLVAGDSFDDALRRLESVAKPFLSTDGGRRLTVRRDEIKRFSTAAKAIDATSWTVRFWQWTGDASAPPPDWDALTRQAPACTETVTKVAFPWKMGRPGALEPDFFAAETSADIDLPAGEYILTTHSDDGVRVWVDGRLTIDEWEPHPERATTVTLPLTTGKHSFRIAYYEGTAVAVLSFSVQPRH